MVLNSISALASTQSPMIKLSGKIDNRGGTLIQIVDNGHGIPEELQEKIFIVLYNAKGRFRHRFKPGTPDNARSQRRNHRPLDSRQGDAVHVEVLSYFRHCTPAECVSLGPANVFYFFRSSLPAISSSIPFLVSGPYVPSFRSWLLWEEKLFHRFP